MVTTSRSPAENTTESARVRTLAAAAIVVLLTLAGYWLLGPRSTPYDFQLSQANNIIHGHLEMTPEHTRNLNLLERVLFDGEGFCLPTEDPRGDQRHELPAETRVTDDCRHYMQHSLGPALLLVPLVSLGGMDVNQTVVSVLIAGLASLIAFVITGRFTERLLNRVVLTLFAMFGTILWWVGSNGSVWLFAHTTAVFFLFAAIWATLNRRSALMAGAFVGAAFMCRPTTILAGVFPLVVFSEQWLRASTVTAGSLWQRLRRKFNLRPLVLLAAGVAPFLVLNGALNYLRFGSLFESGYNYTEQLYQVGLSWRWPYGFFDLRYIPRHVEVVFEHMPTFSTQGSYIWPSHAGLAMWVTSPPFFYAIFVHLQRYRREALFGALLLGAACVAILLRGMGSTLGWGDWAGEGVPLQLHLAPFWVFIGAAILAAFKVRDKIALACWAAIVAIALANAAFAATGWSQFGYRYGLDFTPFLWLLVLMAIGRGPLRWHHWMLMACAFVVNLWGMLWLYHFWPQELFDWTWVGW